MISLLSDDVVLFPCPVCAEGLDVRETKKGKPYVICDPCGVQMFVRNQTGIRKFRHLVEDASTKDVWLRLRELQGRYKKTCPKCGKQFWTSDELIETSVFDGEMIGYRCPEPKCKGIAKREE